MKGWLGEQGAKAPRGRAGIKGGLSHSCVVREVERLSKGWRVRRAGL